LTIPNSAKKLVNKIYNSLGAASIRNFEFVAQDDLADLYSKTSVVIIPSMAEVFSATYLEAFYAGRPLIVPNLPFARELAGPAALYFEPGDSKSLVDCMIRISTNKVLFEHLALESRKRISLFPSFEEKMKIIGHTVIDILNDHK
jgi:glycosyltransferase involved in cell wall biosynthesis